MNHAESRLDIRTSARLLALAICSISVLSWGLAGPGDDDFANPMNEWIGVSLPYGLALSALSLLYARSRVERKLAFCFLGALLVGAWGARTGIWVIFDLKDTWLRHANFLGCAAVGWLLIRAAVAFRGRQRWLRALLWSSPYAASALLLYALLVLSSSAYHGASNLTGMNDNFVSWVPYRLLGRPFLWSVSVFLTIAIALPLTVFSCFLYGIPLLRASSRETNGPARSLVSRQQGNAEPSVRPNGG